MLKYTEIRSQQMAFNQNTSLSNNPKIPNNYLIFTMIMTTMMFLDDDEDSILNPILPWANSSNIGARRNREGSNITAAASNKSFTKT